STQQPRTPRKREAKKARSANRGCTDSHGRRVPCPDKAKTARWLQEHAGAHSQEKCAHYVREGLEAGGFDSTGRPIAAGDYGPFLTSRGAAAVPRDGYTPEMGDIVVFPKSARHIWGHIAVFDGGQWISDFKQRRMSPFRDAQSSNDWTVYRFPNSSP
ncbi:MAG TPA: hypothetical protein VGD56_09960, partial [Gemmatirosa sp.]